MKIRVVLEIEVDPTEWVDVDGCERGEVRDSVKRYVANLAQQGAMLDEAGAEVTLR